MFTLLLFIQFAMPVVWAKEEVSGGRVWQSIKRVIMGSHQGGGLCAIMINSFIPFCVSASHCLQRICFQKTFSASKRLELSVTNIACHCEDVDTSTAEVYKLCLRDRRVNEGWSVCKKAVCKPEVSENSRSREFSTRVSFIFSRSTTRNDFLKSRSRLETWE